MNDEDIRKQQFQRFESLFIELIKEAPIEFHNYWDKYIGYVEYPQLTIVIKAGSIDRLPIDLQERYNSLVKKFKKLSL